MIYRTLIVCVEGLALSINPSFLTAWGTAAILQNVRRNQLFRNINTPVREIYDVWQCFRKVNSYNFAQNNFLVINVEPFSRLNGVEIGKFTTQYLLLLETVFIISEDFAHLNAFRNALIWLRDVIDDFYETNSETVATAFIQRHMNIIIATKWMK